MQNCMTKITLLISICLNFCLKCQNLIWAKSFDGPSGEIGSSCAIDQNGNVYTIGSYNGTVDFDPGPGVFNLTATSAGYFDIFVCKLNASGDFVWAKSMGGSGTDYATSITIDTTGNVYTIGHFESSSDFDPGSGFFNLNSQGFTDVFISKLDSSGNFVWAKQIGGTLSDRSYSILLDPSGNIFITGCFFGTPDFDPGPAVFNLTSSGGWDIFICKLDGLGNFGWAINMGGISFEFSHSMVVDSQGNLIITGFFDSTVDFDPGSGIVNLTSAGSYDVFVAKYTSTGSLIWAKRIGGSGGPDIGYSLDVDNLENIYVTGVFTFTADFNPGVPVYNLIDSGNGSTFICKLDKFGNFSWAKSLQGSGSFEPWSTVSLDWPGNIYVSGQFSGTIYLSSGVSTTSLSSNGSDDFFICKFDSLGNIIWAESFGGIGFDHSTCSVVDSFGNIYLTGRFDDTVDFDPGIINYSLTSMGTDVFVMKLCQTPQISSIQGNPNICFGSVGSYSIFSSLGPPSYTWSLPSGWIGASNTTSINIVPGNIGGNIAVSSINGCGYSTQTLNINIFPLPTITATSNNPIICEGESCILTALGANTYTWNDFLIGASIIISPTATNVYSVSGIDINGCISSNSVVQIVDICTKIEPTMGIDTKISVFPNPTSGKVTIISPYQRITFEIYNSIGQLLLSCYLDNEFSEFDLTNFADGIYFTNFFKCNMPILMGKIIKM